MSHRPSAVLVAALLFPGTAWAQSTWIERPVVPGTPDSIAALDAVRERIVLFTQSSHQASETWEWDGRTWTRRDVNGIPPLQGAAMAYDPARQAPVLFGGELQIGIPLGDSYFWNGSAWTAGQSNEPPPRAHHAMATDPVRNVVVLFGGRQGSFSGDLGDTWETTKSGWRAVPTATGPSPRHDHAMAFDPGLGEVILFGGESYTTGRPVLHGDTWSWNGTRWQQVASSGPAPQANATMSFDPGRQRVVLLGVNGETWEWDGMQWVPRLPLGSTAAGDRTMAYGPRRMVTVAFGVDDGVHASTWTWDGTQWLREPLGLAPAGEKPGSSNAPALAEDLARGTVVLYEPESSGVPDRTWTWDGNGWTLRPLLISPHLKREPAMADDRGRNRVVLAGVDQSDNPATWEWDGRQWLPQNLGGVRPPLDNAAMAYDDARNEVVVFGGRRINSTTDETWTWDGTQWQQHSVSPRPPSLYYGYQMAYDRNRQRIVLYGGVLSPDTWEWDGTAWTRIVPKRVPTATSGFVLAYAPDLGRVVLHGGFDSFNNRINDSVWSWDGATWAPVATIGEAPAITQHHAATHTPSGHVVLFGGGGVATPHATWLLGRGPAASVTSRLGGCLLSMTPFGLPHLGNLSFALDVRTYLGAPPVAVLIGLPATIPTPFSICTLGVDPSASVALFATTDPAGFASVPVPVPGLTSWLGIDLAAQALALVQPIGVGASQALSITLGY